MDKRFISQRGKATMPPESSLKPVPKNAPKKGTIAGIPTWGWIVGAVLGIIIGYFLVRTSSGSSTSSPGVTGGGTAVSPDSSQAPTGVVAPNDLLQALGLSTGTGIVPSSRVTTSSSQNDAATATSESIPSSPEVSAAIPSAISITASSPFPVLIAAGYSPEAAMATSQSVSQGFLTPDSAPLGISSSQFSTFTGTETPLSPPSMIATHFTHGRDVNP